MRSMRLRGQRRRLSARDRRAMERGILTEEVEMQAYDLRKSVDLWGRLSNPDDAVETLTGQGSRASRRSRETPGEGPNRASGPSGNAVPEERGRLSNPVQRRLSRAEIEQLTHLYREGASIDALARQYEVHRTTLIHRLDRAGIARRRVVRKMTDKSVALAAARYARGASLALVASEFGVHQRTLAREFRRAGAPIRARRGWR
jgi:lambda repressor-like predicted transcriptional regulator